METSSEKKYVSEIPFEELKVGDKVLSAVGTPGKIFCFIPKEKSLHQEDNEIVIEWSTGKRSQLWHFWCDLITYLGRE